MRLDEVLSKQTVLSSAAAAAFSVSGEIQPDSDPEFFRLYTTPADRATYHLIRRSDAPEVYRYTPEETIHAGVAGTTIYRVQLRYGTVVQRVSISTSTVGISEARRKPKCDPPCGSTETCACECSDGSSCDPDSLFGGCLGSSGPCKCDCY